MPMLLHPLPSLMSMRNQDTFPVPLVVTVTERRPVTDAPSDGPLKVKDSALPVSEGAGASSNAGAGAMGTAIASTMMARRSTEHAPLMAHRPLLPSFNPPIH